jgi:hypothetical protein
MSSSLRWVVTVAAWVVVLIIFAIWKDVDAHTGGGVVSGALRGVFVAAGFYLPYRWAKGGKPKEE